MLHGGLDFVPEAVQVNALSGPASSRLPLAQIVVQH